MLVKVVLLIDKRKEQAIKYKKILESVGINVFWAKDVFSALNILNNYEPDLVLVSDSIEENITDAIKKLRILSYTIRPVIVSLSKSAHIQDKIEALDSGADDFLSEPIEHEEFKARVLAHLRRHFENNINHNTNLFDSKISFKTLKRVIADDNYWAALLVDIDNFDFYREIYGELAADKMLQTYAAIIHSAVDENDYVGQISNDDFLIITNNYKAEKIAQYLVFAFDTVVEKFYSDLDAQRGYIVSRGDETEGNKIALVSTSIGVISNEYSKYESLRQVVNSLISTHKLAELKTGSNYVFERPKLSAEDSVQAKDYNNNLLIIEPDEALSLLLSTTAQMQGYSPYVINDYANIYNVSDEYSPAVIILDAGNTDELKGIEVCKTIRNDLRFKNSNIILSTTLHDKHKILNAGADLYIPKPYELSTIFNWVEKFIKHYNDN